MRSIENDLIDEYVRGELTAKDRGKFEELFLVSPIRRQRVEFAKSLSEASSKQPASPATTNEQETGAFWNIFRATGQRSRVMVYGVAVLVVAVIIGSLWLFVRRTSRSEPVTAQQQTENKQASSVAAPTPGTTAAQTPGNPIESSSPPSNGERVSNGERPSGGSTAQSNVATFILLPGLSRSEGERTKLGVPTGCTSINLKLILTEPDAKRYRKFEAELSSAPGKVWTAKVLSKRKDGSVILNFPVSRLEPKTSNYDLTLRGQTEPGESFETLGYYYLTIARE